MLKLLLIRFWPALIPIMLYILLKWLKKPAASYEDVIDADKSSPHWIKTPLFWVITSSAVILLICFISLGVYSTQNSEGHYVPPAMGTDGKLIDGHVE